ncbi:hypothetical protein JMJ77_0012477 [Colletotrichum scovillei]|uniref:Uncharacterized protein n=1 Tax=Colletotrichum scovillei TaxID=1209932 RepID=A0A9P7QX36_9PEZI|nr:hypothetical protein JMJ78_0001489 [Colletotrichum scovillei]KAG7041961.1 hypothetical protein JMJ77_0012477 [Colletotrichum scovillei]KAG7061992.1 hypothetical protein JMJ76_0003946 [Colletotrichum scovillei]
MSGKRRSTYSVHTPTPPTQTVQCFRCQSSVNSAPLNGTTLPPKSSFRKSIPAKGRPTGPTSLPSYTFAKVSRWSVLPDSRPHSVSRLTLPSPCPACGVRHGSVQTYLTRLHSKSPSSKTSTPPEPQASKSISSTAQHSSTSHCDSYRDQLRLHPTTARYGYHASSQTDISRDNIQHSVQLHHVTKNSIAPTTRGILD